MIDAGAVAALVRSFDVPADGELVKSRELILLLLELTPAPFSRRQFKPGHITCTGLVLASDGRRVLLVHHRRLDRWLLPGGHVEPEDEAIWDAAAREVREETGVALHEQGIPPLAGVDVHGIPGKNDEPYHLHHDLILQYRARTDEFRLSHETRAIAWCAPEEFDRYQVPANVRRAFLRASKY